MTSLAEQLAELLDPGIVSVDPEDDIYEETKAKLVEKSDLNDVDHVDDKTTGIGVRKMQSLEGMGVLYSGKVVSRKKAMKDDDEISDEDVDQDIKEDDASNASDLDSDQSEEEVESEDNFENGIDLDNENGMDEEIDSDEAEGDLQIFKSNVKHEASKGKATRNQLCLWETMLESRIKCQKLLSITNQLPQCNTMNIFSSQLSDRLMSTDKILATLLFKLLELENKLLKQNVQTQDITKSDSSTIKRKSTTAIEDLDQEMNDRFLTMRRHRNKVLKLWYDKTRLLSTTGNAKSKSFSSFERSTVTQIEDILQDPERLVKRTQLKRSDSKILGTTKSSEKANTNGETPNHSTHLKEFDEEIFDDSDFYHQLLRQLIEQKASGPGGVSDPVELTRQWLKIQRLRSKVKKNVDTKASKGRKIRYEIHQKLQSFMAPNDKSEFTHEARNQLFKSLFGNIPDIAEYTPEL